MRVATLLDFDGVLVDSEPVHLAAFNDVLSSFGLCISPSEYEEHYLSLDDAGVFRQVFERGGRAIHRQEVLALVAAKSPRFMARFEDAFRVFPGAPELIRRRRLRGPVAIVSGALEREIAFALERMEVRDQVDFIVDAEASTASKPDPAPFRLACETLRKLGHDGPTIAVEDSMGGVVSAKGAGLRCVAVTHSYSAQRLLEAGADGIVADLFALTDELLEGDV
ncbi:MAG TPA: HAD family phosphatase [Polyangiaceae bacterium]|nr:HAD family phosphatase [Polyangiaceae bacterium]